MTGTGWSRSRTAGWRPATLASSPSWTKTGSQQSPEIDAQELATLETASVTSKTFSEGMEGNRRLKGLLAS